jgi:hypothetical protein
MFIAITEIPTLILWLETICSNSTRNLKVKSEENSQDIKKMPTVVTSSP